MCLMKEVRTSSWATRRSSRSNMNDIDPIKHQIDAAERSVAVGATAPALWLLIKTVRMIYAKVKALEESHK
jgi:hypothetical protein